MLDLMELHNHAELIGAFVGRLVTVIGAVEVDDLSPHL